MAKMIKYYKDMLIEYDLMELVDYYNPILRKPTIPYDFNAADSHKNAIYLMFSLSETLNATGGLGLSANQVGLSNKVCVVNMGDEIWTLFNPEIIDQSEVKTEYAEGCLSYPGLYLKLNRPDHIKVRFQAVTGEFIEREFDGLTAVCVQHEIDHLNGILFTDNMSQLKLERAKRKVKTNLKKMKRVARATPEVERESQTVAVAKHEIPQPDKFVYNLEL